MSNNNVHHNVRNVLELLKSKKVRDRQEGLTTLKDLFSSDRVVSRFHVNDKQEANPQAWLAIFQGLFECIRTERTTLFSSAKGAGAAEKRLSSAAGVVRWFVERTSRLMNKRVVTCVYEHLLPTITFRGQLLGPVVLDYVNALKVLVSFTPHLEHLGEEMWVRMVEVSFNVIVGKPLKATFADDDNSPIPDSPATTDNSELFIEDSLMYDNDDDDMGAATGSKRRRREASVAPQYTQSRSHPVKRPNSQLVVTSEQRAFASLLTILLQSNSAPLLKDEHASAILRRLQIFFEMYPADSSLHPELLQITLSILNNLSLNRKNDVMMFARSNWNRLLGLWGTKNKSLKETLVSILRILFPFLTIDPDSLGTSASIWSENLWKLWDLLNGEAENKWGVDGLSMDAIRLEFISNDFGWETEGRNRACIANTFRAGPGFDPGQALTWAILELQADCAEKLFEYSESIHSRPSSSQTTQGAGKRLRIEDPVASLLRSIRLQVSPTLRIYHLQILLFFIDRHWSVLHDAMQSEVMNTLMQLVAYDDGQGGTQSWTFLCYAAIAHADCTRLGVVTSAGPSSLNPQATSHLPRDASTWDPIWTHAIRRTNVPTVSRCACHAAGALLFYLTSHSSERSFTRAPLTSHRVLSEIETVAKDLDVQGPVGPYDSVCCFLSLCLRVANQDVRLYRMQLEEKVLSWLVDSWSLDRGNNAEVQFYLPKDILLLLETICACSQRSSLISRVMLPQCAIVHTLEEEDRTRIIKEFVLYARLPVLSKEHKLSRAGEAVGSTSLKSSPSAVPVEADLVQPQGKERRISSFFLKSLEALLLQWQDFVASKSLPRAGVSRNSINVAVIALSFESVLALNGIRPNRKVVQSACKLISLVTPHLTNTRWNAEEKTLVLLALEPLTSTGLVDYDHPPWVAMLPPNLGTGIKQKTLRSLLSDDQRKTDFLRLSRMNHLKALWQSPDVQDTFEDVLKTLRNLLRLLIGKSPEGSHAFDTRAVDEKDDFDLIRTSVPSQESVSQNEDSVSLRRIGDVCVSFLAVAPILQSVSGEPTRDKELTDLILGCASPDPEKFLLVCPILLNSVRNQTLSLTPNNLDLFLNAIGELLRSYAYSRSEQLQHLTVSFLDATLPLWTSPTVAMTEVGNKIRQLCQWFCNQLKKQKITSWRIRDSLARFFDRYLERDPYQRVWIGPDDEGSDDGQSVKLPTTLLPSMNADNDIRVRFRAAAINAHLYEIARQVGQRPMELYKVMREHYTVDLDNFEFMLTRMLSLGNIMIVSSAVRRGPYWHLLETCFHSNVYTRHIQTILHAVSQRMGLRKFSDLFEAYASQLAYSIRQGFNDVLRVPPHLLGYKDRGECARETFRAFTPTNVLALGGTSEVIAHGRRSFEIHCKVIQKSREDGVRECFGDIVGYQILDWFVNTDRSPEGIVASLMQTLHTEDSVALQKMLQETVDGVTVSTLRALGDQDFSINGNIVNALHVVDDTGESARVFSKLSKYRNSRDFDTHEPNLPIFDAGTILRALTWLMEEASVSDDTALTYHVIQELFADVHRSPLVNEQMRLVNAISLWVAYRHEAFNDSTLLHSLIRGACSLLQQSDCIRAAQSILEWAFSCYRSITVKDPRFPDILVRIACQCHDYYIEGPDSTVAKTGRELLDWIDMQALQLSQISTLKDQVEFAIPAWPHEPIAELVDSFSVITSSSLSQVLMDRHISSNKFRLVRRLRDHAQLKIYDQAQFAQTDFWRLKNCIPPREQLREEDAHAFASLLVLTQGSISSFGSEQLLSAPSPNQSKQRKDAKENHDSPPEKIIVLALLDMLESDDDAPRYAAYRTLRSLMSVVAHQTEFSSPWPSEYRDEIHYLQKFRLSPESRATPNMYEVLSSEEYVDAGKEFPRWIAMITVLLADILAESNPFYAQLRSILQSHTVFAQQTLPFLVQTLLQASKDNSYAAVLSKYFHSMLSSDHASEPCRRSIIDVVLHLRHISPSLPDALAYDKWLDVDFLLLARNAISCGAYTTALLFLELASEYRNESVKDGTVAEQIMYDIYSNIDEPDGFYGIRTKDHHQFLMKRFHHEKQWDKAFRFHGAALEADMNNAGDAEGLLDSFHSYGFNHLATRTLLHDVSSQNTDSNLTYQLGWRTETWDLPEREDLRYPGASLYLALRALHRERDQRVADSVIRHVIFREMDHLRTLGTENIAQIREVVQTLMSLGQAVQWRDPAIQDIITAKSPDHQAWSDFMMFEPGFEFADIESIVATRISLIRSVRQKEERQQIGMLVSPFTSLLLDVEKQCLLRLSKAAREAHQDQIALNSVIRAKKLEASASIAVAEEFASVLWLHKEEKHAVEYLKDLVRTVDQANSSVKPEQMALIYARLGTWTAEACLEKPLYILKEFFTPAISLLGPLPQQTKSESHGSVYHTCAIFAQRQYHAITNSPDAIRLKVYRERKEKELSERNAALDRLRAKDSSDSREVKDLLNSINKVRKVLHQDKLAESQFSKDRNVFLEQALDMYYRCLEASDSFDDDAPIRFCSLWLANFDSLAIQDLLTKALARVPSRKFVFLAHQLSARLSSEGSRPQQTLRKVILRMCMEHPFHSLYQVFCLKPLGLQDNGKRRSSGRQMESTSRFPSAPTARGAAAAEIFDQLRSDSNHSARVRAIEELCQASLEWANYPIKGNKSFSQGKEYNVPNHLLIRKLEIRSQRVPVITVHTPIDPSMKYDNCVWVDKYKTTFETAGGVNLPKISVCIGSDGRKYKQLFKGEESDDLRQDAVMEQVFELVNTVLRSDGETRRRNLCVRGYKVIPLATQAGVLEFVGNTSPLRGWLVEAHPRYRPNDMKRISSEYATFHKDQNRTKEEKLRFFLDCRENFQPVMRHYFTEKHKTPISWFAMRLNYTRSVATTSIVGHVLGLGDRHTSNILMDNTTGEVVHIDLGIAFDQGKLLPVPENVPFRMTADMVDGMGISGTDGVFQRCAEETLRVLREGSEVVMTVLEVFRHDPLHTWTVSEIKAQKVQRPGTIAMSTTTATDAAQNLGIGIDMNSGTAEEAADRALSGVSRKLDKTLSVAATVRGLVAEATDPANLSTIFHGWGPYY